MNPLNIGIVVLAAGESQRFGSPKLVVPIDGVPLIRRVTLVALGASANVVVVCGAHREVIESHISDLSVARVFNRDWSSGMGSSIARGIAALSDVSEAAIILLADQALIGAKDFCALIAAHARAPDRIIAARYAGVLGPPCVFPRAYFAELAALRGTQGARALLDLHAAAVDALPMPCAATDIDTIEDYAQLRP